jgi:quinohemoprotein ethanol dehydrogenase
MSYNPMTGLAYIPTIHLSATYSDEGIDIDRWQSIPFVGGMGVSAGGYRPPAGMSYIGALQAWDPVRQESVWNVPQSTHWNAGTLTTAGNLVFQGQADGHFRAYDAKTGKRLWDVDLGLGISAPPITYRINGRQYIAILVGIGGAEAGLGGMASYGWSYGIHTRLLIAFSLDGKKAIPKQPAPFFPVPIDIPNMKIDDALVRQGKALFSLCSYCHGGGAVAAGMAPDLRASPIPLQDQLFKQVVHGGAKIARGMPAYGRLTDEQLKGLQHYIRSRARSDKPVEATRQ